MSAYSEPGRRPRSRPSDRRRPACAARTARRSCRYGRHDLHARPGARRRCGRSATTAEGRPDDADEPEPVDGADRAARDSPSISMVRSDDVAARGRAGTAATAMTGQERAGRGRSNHSAHVRRSTARCLLGAQPRAVRTRRHRPRVGLVAGEARRTSPARSCGRTGRVCSREVDRRTSVVELGPGVGERVGGGARACRGTRRRAATRGRRATCRCGSRRAIARRTRAVRRATRGASSGSGDREHAERADRGRRRCARSDRTR